MRCFHTTTYNINSNKEFKICILSDIHFSKQFKTSRLNYIKNYIFELNPDYIFIAGDLLESLDVIKREKEKTRIKTWLVNISKVSKIFIVLGNHDMFRNHKFDKKNSFFKSINEIKNIFVLDNEIYEDNNIYVCGVTESPRFYKTSDIEVLKEDLNRSCEYLKYNKMKAKFLLIHSPVGFDVEEINNITKNFDYIITGHMHNGCVPPIINELWKSTRGIISPKKKFFIKNERNTLNKKDDRLLVNGPVTTFSNYSGFMHYFNIIYPIYNSVFEFNKKEFNIKRKYHLK